MHLQRRTAAAMQALSQLYSFFTIKRTNLFDAEIYRQLNPACTFGDAACLWHWVRHGVFEDRTPSQDAFSIWALSLLARREISVSKVKFLSRHKNSENFEHYCTSKNVDWSELKYLEAYEYGRFSDAINFLDKTSGVFFLRKVHGSMRRMPVLRDLETCYQKISADPSLDPQKLHPKDRGKIYDIAFAAGRPWAELAALALRGRQRRDDDDARLAIGQTLAVSHQPAVFHTLAQHNERQTRDFLAVCQGVGGVRICRPSREAVIVFAPDADFIASSDYTQEFVVSCFQKIIQILLKENRTIVFLPMPFARDLSSVRLPFGQAVSYHTFAENRPDIVHYKEGTFRHFLLIDTEGYSGASRLARIADKGARLSARQMRQDKNAEPRSDAGGAFTAPERLNEIENNQSSPLLETRRAYQTSSITKYAQMGDDQDIPETDYIFVPMQVKDDSVRRWQYLSSSEIVEALAGQRFLAEERIVVKPHPFDNSPITRKILAQLDEQGKIKVVTAPIQSLLAGAKLVITANSGVGLEALLMHKPLIVTGESDYSYPLPVCKDERDLLTAVKRLLDDSRSFDTNKVEAFLQNFFSQYYIRPLSPTGEESLRNFLVSNLNDKTTAARI